MSMKPTFKMNPVAAAVTSALLVGSTCAAVAQEEIEEIVTIGIRGSLQSSMNIKRNSTGIVDAITAEDIGKFPDTNLAESMQRITGVSISRVEGEGSEITVRGFGAENNLVTLNGRQLPTAITFGGGSGAPGTEGGSSRSFDFANLASESVSAVEVFKTGRADITTGGIGATVNIVTARPLAMPGMHGTVSAKGVTDTTNNDNSEVTPELAGIFSWTDDEETFGVAVSASYQERNSGKAGVSVNDWNISSWNAADWLTNSIYSFAPGAVVENEPADGQLYARPNDLRYFWSQTERERTNAQVTLQYRPFDNFTGTLDYTYAENDISERRGEATSWIANGTSVTRVVFDGASGVASPLLIEEALSTKDHGFEQELRMQENKLDSVGINLEFQATDRLSFALDAHNSTMDSLPSNPGGSGEIAFSMANPSQTSQFLDFSTDAPTYNFTFDDSVPDLRGTPPGVNSITGFFGNNNGQFDVGDVGTQVLRLFYAGQTTEITQVRLDGSLDFDDDGGRFDFGVESRALEMVQQNSDRYQPLGDWGVARPDDIPDELLQSFNLAAQFDDYNTSASSQLGYRGNAEDLANWAIAYYPGSLNADGITYTPYTLAKNTNYSNDSKVEEDTTAVYFQFAMPGELGGMETNLLAGLRYESTDVTSTTKLAVPLHLIWRDNNDFNTILATQTTPYAVDADYDNLLPSFDFDILLRDDLKARFSYSKTISRAGYGNLNSVVGNLGRVGSTFNGTIATAAASNPALVPLESDNLDLSVEYYYGDSNYASIGFFEKRVDNFIGTEQVDETQFGILDQTGGPRAEAAAAALTAGGHPVDDTTLFVMIAILENPAAFPNGAADYDGTQAQAIDVATTYDIIPVTGDPEMIFRTSKPVNNREAKIYGAEIGVQHFFGDSGFGVVANYTMVRGDIGFDDAADPSVAQFALTGLSDTANLVGIYEKNKIQARLAYNWRDAYLDQVNRGNSRNPTYVDSYFQIDMTVTYLFNDQLSVFAEGLNLTGEDIRQYGRSESQVWYLEDLGSRYQIGARYSFK